MFGKPLTEVVSNDGLDASSNIPALVDGAVAKVIASELTDIQVQTGSDFASIAALRMQVDDGFMLDMDEVSPNDLVELVRAFIFHLPAPLVAPDVVKAMILVTTMPPSEARLEKMRYLLGTLAVAERNTLQRVIELLRALATKANVPHDDILAGFAYGFMRDPSAATLSLLRLNALSPLITFLLTEYTPVFTVPLSSDTEYVSYGVARTSLVPFSPSFMATNTSDVVFVIRQGAGQPLWLGESPSGKGHFPPGAIQTVGFLPPLQASAKPAASLEMAPMARSNATALRGAPLVISIGGKTVYNGDIQHSSAFKDPMASPSPSIAITLVTGDTTSILAVGDNAVLHHKMGIMVEEKLLHAVTAMDPAAPIGSTIGIKLDSPVGSISTVQMYVPKNGTLAEANAALALAFSVPEAYLRLVIGDLNSSDNPDESVTRLEAETVDGVFTLITVGAPQAAGVVPPAASSTSSGEGASSSGGNAEAGSSSGAGASSSAGGSEEGGDGGEPVILQVWFPEGSYKKLKSTTTTACFEVVAKIASNRAVAAESYTLGLVAAKSTSPSKYLTDSEVPSVVLKSKPGSRLMFVKKLQRSGEAAVNVRELNRKSSVTILQVFYEDHYSSFRCGSTTTADELVSQVMRKPVFAGKSKAEYALYEKVGEVQRQLGPGEHPSDLFNKYSQEGVVVQFFLRQSVVKVEEYAFIEERTVQEKVKLEDFKLLKVIGRGGYGKVCQVQKKDDGSIFAMKIISKASIVKEKDLIHTREEQRILAEIRHPFLLNLQYSFQTPEKLYLVMDYVNGGELFFHLSQEGFFSEERSKFYLAELILALDHLHSKNILYRDLKPENVLLSAEGHVRLCDFGLAKTTTQSTRTICGTAEYLAPEILKDQGYGPPCDNWACGVLLYEFVTGAPPFVAKEGEGQVSLFRAILYSDPPLDPALWSDNASDFLLKMMAKNPDERLGTGGVEEIQNHPFFAGYDWDALLRLEVEPPFKPDVEDETSTANVDEEFLAMPITETFVDESELSSLVQGSAFDNFTYVAGSALRDA